MRVAALVGAMCLILGVTPAMAFVIEYIDPRPEDAVYTMMTAHRWDANNEAMTWRGERGLGGGLEFSVAADFCEKMNFPEKPACSRVHEIILEAGQKVANGHKQIHFRDVSSLIAPVEWSAETPDQVGAEIDFLAVDRETMDRHGPDNAAYKNFYVDFEKQSLSTNGATLINSARTTSVDITLATDQCFYIDDPEPEDGCIHFGSMVMHELMHAIGLDHPQEFAAVNFDTDDDPDNEMVIDCHDTMSGLRLSNKVAEHTVSNHFVTGDENWRTGLTADDRAGLAFLYPVCPGTDAATNGDTGK